MRGPESGQLLNEKPPPPSSLNARQCLKLSHAPSRQGSGWLVDTRLTCRGRLSSDNNESPGWVGPAGVVTLPTLPTELWTWPASFGDEERQNQTDDSLKTNKFFSFSPKTDGSGISILDHLDLSNDCGSEALREEMEPRTFVTCLTVFFSFSKFGWFLIDPNDQYLSSCCCFDCFSV